MTPETDAMLNGAAMKLLGEIAPQLPPGYIVGQISTVAMVMILSAQQFDKAADTRAWENETMRALLKRGGVDAPPATPGLSISTLNADNTALSTLLIALHERAEREDTALERDILAYLKESTARRRLYLPVM